MASDAMKKVGAGVLAAAALGAAVFVGIRTLQDGRVDGNGARDAFLRDTSNETLLEMKAEFENYITPDTPADMRASYEKQIAAIDAQIEARKTAGDWDDSLRAPTPEELAAARAARGEGR